MAGFTHENFIYVLISLTNETERPLTFYPKDCSFQYQFNNDTITLQPIKAKNLDKDHFSFFNTILVGAGSISRLFINLPVDMLIKSEEKDDKALSNIDEEYHDDDTRITKKIFMSTHTIFSEGHYAGFIAFEFDDDQPISKEQFTMKITFDDQEFSGVGNFIN